MTKTTWDSAFEFRYFQSETALAEHILECLQKHKAKYSLITASWIDTINQISVNNVTSFVNDDIALAWFQKILAKVKANPNRSLIISNFPRVFPPDSGFRLVDSPDDTCAVYFTGVHVPSYYESVLKNIGTTAQRCVACQVLSHPRDSGLLPEELRKLSILDDKQEIQKALKDASEDLEQQIAASPQYRSTPEYAGGILR